VRALVRSSQSASQYQDHRESNPWAGIGVAYGLGAAVFGNLLILVSGVCLIVYMREPDG
jgi:hypothetical protein